MSKEITIANKDLKQELAQIGQLIALYSWLLTDDKEIFLNGLRQKKKQARQRWKSSLMALAKAEKKGQKKRLKKARKQVKAMKRYFQVYKSQYQLAKTLK